MQLQHLIISAYDSLMHIHCTCIQYHCDPQFLASFFVKLCRGWDTKVLQNMTCNIFSAWWKKCIFQGTWNNMPYSLRTLVPHVWGRIFRMHNFVQGGFLGMIILKVWEKSNFASHPAPGPGVGANFYNHWINIIFYSASDEYKLMMVPDPPMG